MQKTLATLEITLTHNQVPKNYKITTFTAQGIIAVLPQQIGICGIWLQAHMPNSKLSFS